MPWLCGSHGGVPAWASVPGIASRRNSYLPDLQRRIPPARGRRISYQFMKKKNAALNSEG